MSREGRWSALDDERPLFGREDLVTLVIDALGEAPVVTLVGDGGFGKSRVARRVVTEVSKAGQRALPIDLAEQGATDLAAMRASTVASSAVGGALVLIDNIVETPGWIGDFVAGMRHSPQVRLLVTSRHALGVSGERVITVGPINDEAAVQLFEHAATSEWRRLPLGPCNADITRICHVLDGWPLAIEVAARRTKVQSVGELLLALENDPLLSVLDDPVLEQTATIRGILTATAARMPDDERALVDRLAGFADWLTLSESADVAPEPSHALDVLTSLVERHVVEMDDDDGTTLFRLRRPYRELINEQLAALPAEASTQLVQVDSLRRFARASIDGLLAAATAGGDFSRWYSAIDRRRCDLRAAGLALLSADDAEGAAELTLALSMHAAERGDLSDDNGMLDTVLAAVTADGEGTPALELMLRGFQLRRQVEAVDPMTDTEQLATELRAAVSDASELGDPRITLTLLGHSVRSARTIGHFGQAAHHAEEAVELALSASLPVAEATFELLGAMVAHADGRVADAAALGARALMRARRLDLRVLTAQAALLLRQLPAGTPDVPPVLPSARDVLDLLDGQFDDRSSIGLTYGVAGECMLAGDPATAARAAALGMRTASAIGLPAGVDPGVMIVVALAAHTGEVALAARLHGALADHLEQARHSVSPGQGNMYDRIVDLVRHRLGDEAFAREMGRGAGLTRRAMIDEALRFVDTVAEPRATAGPSTPPTSPAPSLTRRELEVLRLLAEGSTNKEIAAQLGMAPKTAMHHTSKIYRKLGVRGRGQAAASARRAGIV